MGRPLGKSVANIPMVSARWNDTVDYYYFLELPFKKRIGNISFTLMQQLEIWSLRKDHIPLKLLRVQNNFEKNRVY